MVMRFMGQEFANREELKRAFPAFAGDDAVRAIRAGAQTPMEVEVKCLEFRKGARQRALAAARSNARIVNDACKRARERKAKKVAKLPPLQFGGKG